jgi:flagellar FliL protein
MTDANAAAAPARRSPMLLIVMILLLLVVLGGGGGAAWYFMMGKAHSPAGEAHAAENPIPFTLAIKPFVITMASADGTPRFVQLGVNLQLPGAGAGEVVANVMPQLQDAMRQAVLGFKADELQTVDGINKVRGAMVTQTNQVLAQLLGAGRITQLTGGAKTGLVQNIYFPTLIIE